MFEGFRLLFSPPTFDNDDDKTRDARVLNALLLSLIAGLALIGFVTKFERLTNYLLSLVLAVGTWLVMRRGYIRAASIIIVTGLSILLAIVVPLTGGVRASTYGGFIVVILLAGFLLGSRTSILVALFGSTVGAVWLGFEEFGILELPLPTASHLTYWIVFTVYFIVSAIVLSLAVGLKDEGFQKAKQELAERLHTENELRFSEERLQQAIRAGSIGIFDHDHIKDKIYWSPQQRNIYGWDLIETVTLDRFLAQVYTEDAKWIEAAVRRAHNPSGDGLFDVDHRIMRKDGEVRWLSTRAQTTFGDIGGMRHPIRTIGAVMDITERKQIEKEREQFIKELQERNAELTRFNYTISHELKNPVVTIKGFIGSIENDLKTKNYDRALKDLGRVSVATDKMHKTLLDLLELSQIGRVVNPSTEIDLAQVITAALDTVSGRIQEKNITLQVAAGLPPSVYADRSRLQEVFENLIDNAAKYMGDQTQPVIEIGKRDDDNELILFVKNNGMGIEPQYHTRIFNLFEKLDPNSEGTGVGLALVKSIIEFHGGKIWVESDGLGRGSTFCFTLSKPDN